MHLTFKDLQQKKFTIEAEPSATVFNPFTHSNLISQILEVKQKIHESQGHDVEAQKLIYSGILPSGKRGSSRNRKNLTR